MDKLSLKQSIAGLTLSEIAAAFSLHGIDEKYGLKVACHVYKKRGVSLKDLNNIAGTTKGTIVSQFISGITPPDKRIESADKSVKYIFEYPGNRVIETVYIPETKRKTICLSTQCGCSRGCMYCHTGDMGLKGNLSANEIVNQVLSIPESAGITHVVFMGMGEPLDNSTEVIKAIEILTAEWGLALGHSNITVSTVGIIPGIERLLASTRCNLTLSLGSPISSERAAIIPAEKLYPAATIIALLNSSPRIKHRRYTIAYVMLDEINDSDAHLDALISLVRRSSIRVNILKYHTHGGSTFKPSSPERMEFFRSRLLSAGISTSIRKSRGEDISAACGMLGE